MGVKLNLEGQLFGRLTVMQAAPNKVTSGGNSFAQWVCQCACGKTMTTYGNSLRSGHTTSCGCLKLERFIARQTKYEPGVIDSSIYRTWATMLARCRNPKSRVYHHYGGRGIRVCERWTSFAAFLVDVGPKPKGTSLDRIDNDGDYEPSNVRWATGKQQHNNKRSNVPVVIAGRQQSLQAWADELGISRTTLSKHPAQYGATVLQKAIPHYRSQP